MKAWQVSDYGEPGDVLKLGEKELPEPGPGELLIQVHAAAFGLPDVLMCKQQYLFEPPRPFTPGQEISGTVLAAGPGCETPVGARIMSVTAFYNGHGGLAEHAIGLDGSAFPIPNTMSDSEAAAFAIPYHTAYVGLKLRGDLKEGEWVLVLGAAGGTGTAAIQLAKALGGKVIAAASSTDKLAHCKRCGADVLINTSEEELSTAVMSATQGQGANLVYDPVGGPSFEQALNGIANEARLLAIGFASGEWGQIATELAVLKNCSLMGVYVGAYSPAQMQNVHAQLLALYAEGKISVAIDREISFDDVPGALQSLADRRVQGKVVVAMKI